MTNPEDSDHEREFDQAAWEARYSEKESGIWSGNPNAVLVAEIFDLTPGTALDVGCGEGADALWLASRGWRVTGVDISTVALGRAAAHADGRRAAAHADKQGVDVEWRQADLLADPPRPESFDLVTAHFMQLPEPKRTALYRELAAAVVPGGTLLLVGHHPEGLPAGAHRPHLLDMLFTPEQVVADLDPDRWEVQVAETRSRQATGPDGDEITVGDSVVRARRNPGIS